MAGLSSKGEIAVLAPLTTSAYISLHTADPTDTGLNEVSGGGYARVGPAAFSNSGSNNPTVASNSAIITYQPATAPWGTIQFFGIWDAAVGGNFRGSGAVTPNKTVNSGDTARFVVAALTITVN